LQTLLQVLDEEDAFMVLALDEFDSLIDKEGSDAVYKLTRLQEMRQGKPQRLSFIFILRDLAAIAGLDESAKSTLQRTIISLERYGKPQLIDILNDRVAMAFELGAVSDDVVDSIAELAFTQTGNARFGIELLWRAGKYADAEEAGAVEPEFVRMAVSSIVPGLRRSELASLGLHEKFFLLAVARFFNENDEAYVSLSEAEQAYRVVCEEFEVEPNSHTQLWNYAQYLAKLGVLKAEVASAQTRGRTTRLSMPAIPAAELEQQLEMSLEQQRGR
jgi:archaeal cell division control protein 6